MGNLFPLLTLLQQAYFRYEMIGFPLSAICSRSPMGMDKLHFFVLSCWKQFFILFKGRGPFKFSKKYPAATQYTDIYRLVLLLTHLSFRWTLPLKRSLYCIWKSNISVSTLDEKRILSPLSTPVNSHWIIPLMNLYFCLKGVKERGARGAFSLLIGSSIT